MQRSGRSELDPWQQPCLGLKDPEPDLSGFLRSKPHQAAEQRTRACRLTNAGAKYTLSHTTFWVALGKLLFLNPTDLTRFVGRRS